MRRIINISLIILFALTACKTNYENKDKEIFEEADKLLKEQKFPMAVVQFEKIVSEYPKGDYYPKSLFELGKIYNAKLISTMDAKANCEKAVYYFRKLYNEYPASTYAEQALFLTGFLYANELKYLDSAKTTYNSFLEKFPQSQFVTSVKAELENMGKTPEEILNQKTGK